MKRTLLKVAVIFPLLGMLIPMVVGLFVPGYSSVSQHMSELEMLSGPVNLAIRLGALLTGLSIIGFGLAVLPRMRFTAIAAFIFGVSMASNGVFTMGGPLHGLWGIGLTGVLVPAFFAAESPAAWGAQGRDSITLLASLLTLFYMWLLVTGLDPLSIHGLTQRIAVFPTFGWFSYVGLKLLGSRGMAGQGVPSLSYK